MEGRKTQELYNICSSVNPIDAAASRSADHRLPAQREAPDSLDTLSHARTRISMPDNMQISPKYGRDPSPLVSTISPGFVSKLTLHTSRKPPRSCTNTYSLYRSSGVLEMVGQAVIGVRRSSIKASSLSSQGLRSGLSSMSYSLFRLSDFCGRERE